MIDFLQTSATDLMIPPWLSILRGALDQEFGERPRAAVLATVDENHRPRARTIIVRRITDSGLIVFVSDARSRKNAQLRQTPAAELVFYLPTLRQQFRVFGWTAVQDARTGPSLLNEMWLSLTDPARALFASPHPGEAIPESGATIPQSLPAAAPIPENFEVITLRPEEVERLELNYTPHHRTRWREATNWSPESINP
jgi:pyridoxamine 5'-phosphate oxidase